MFFIQTYFDAYVNKTDVRKKTNKIIDTHVCLCLCVFTTQKISYKVIIVEEKKGAAIKKVHFMYLSNLRYV